MNAETSFDPGRQGADAQEPDLPQAVALAFAPLHKRALGIATGLAAGVSVFLLTAFHVVARPEPALDISILNQYFYGYSVSWPGAFIGFAWAFFVGFVAGWFTAFCRNLVLAVWIFIGRTKAELTANRGFLDHI